MIRSTPRSGFGSTLAVHVRAEPPDAVTLELSGELDLCSADLFEAVVADQLRSRRRILTVDLADLTFMDASGLRAIVEARNELLARRGQLVLLHVGVQVARLLRITQLDTVLTVRAD